MPGPKKLYHDKSLFITEAQKIHGDHYDYTRSTLKGSTVKISIHCNECGNNFDCNPWDHLYGSRGKGRSCPHCANRARSKTLTKDQKWFFNELKTRRTDKGEHYDYSRVVYTKSTDRIEIGCPKHGWFKQLAWAHLNGSGCPHCGMETTQAARQDDWDSYFEKIKARRKDKGEHYDYSKVIYKKANEPIEIICPHHGSFWQSPQVHLRGAGCPICKQSKLEESVRYILQELNINFIQQKRFPWLGTKSLDFYLPDYKIAIECQGIQHYKEVPFFKSRTLAELQLADAQKYRKCRYRGVSVKYIKYNEKDIKAKLLKILKKEVN